MTGPYNKVYISGPMRAHDGFNFPAFFEAEKWVKRCVHDTHGEEPYVYNPARADIVRFHLSHMLDEDPTGLTAGRHLKETLTFGPADLRKALGGDLDFICRQCDLIVLLPGWEDSMGAKAEVAAADALGIDVRVWTPEGLIERESPVSGPPVARFSPCVQVGRAFLGETVEKFDILDGAHNVVGSHEVRVTSATGGQKGTKLAAFDQISPEVERLVAEHFGKGARKYDAHNFRKGYPWSLSYSALRRHLADFWSGKEYDVCGPDCDRPEPRGESANGPTCFNHTGSLHIVAVIWHAMVLTEFFHHHKEYDDRYVYENH